MDQSRIRYPGSPEIQLLETGYPRQVFQPRIGDGGLAQVQGNEKLIRSALKSVLLGFTVALGIGFLVGLMLHVFAPGVAITSEMYDRGSPNLLDLIVALASGVAAAYAMGRPNLISALPGVASAAALVPPIATSGLSLAMGDFPLFGGSMLLFATNIVAIILGTAIMLMFPGQFDGQRDGKADRSFGGSFLAKAAFTLMVVVALSNVISTFLECGPGICDDPPLDYKELDRLEGDA